jgi:hypothetical protein
MPDEKPNPPEMPAEEMERFRGAMRQILTVSKPEILRREREAKEQRKQERKKHV